MQSRWKALLRCLDDGRLALNNDPAERALRCVAIGRKNYLFAGSDAGGRRAAALYSLIETAKLNDLDPHKYLADVLARIADHPARQIAGLLPWTETRRAAARRRLTRRLHRALTARRSGCGVLRRFFIAQVLGAAQQRLGAQEGGEAAGLFNRQRART